MDKFIRIGEHLVGSGQPTYIVAEIGINHNGDIELAKRMVDAAVHAGVDAVKFQKRTPELCVPPDQRNHMRETPWGYITYLDYRYKVEFGKEEYTQIDRHCKQKGIPWFASVWDEPSVDFMQAFDPVCYKIPSASLTNHALLLHLRKTGLPVILSTGMSTMEEIRTAVDVLGKENLLITHATSTYPCEPDELNLRMIQTLQQNFSCPIGYSGHEVGLIPSVVATNNIYMHQISVSGSAYTPNNTRWHRKVAGTYTAEPQPFTDNATKDQQVWYRVKFEVRSGYNFKIYIGEVGAAPKDLTLVGNWTDSAKSFKQGKIGFRMSGTEYAQYDNVVVTTPNYNFAVDQQGKLALTWGGIKTQN